MKYRYCLASELATFALKVPCNGSHAIVYRSKENVHTINGQVSTTYVSSFVMIRQHKLEIVTVLGTIQRPLKM